MEKEHNNPRSLFILGCISAISISLGTFFKLNAWPAASVLYLIGLFSLIFLYLPLWAVAQMKYSSKGLVIFELLVLELTAFAFMFKTFHWPAAGLFFKVWLFFSMCVLFPFAIYLLLRSGKKSIRSFHYTIVLFLLGSMSISTVRSTSSYLIRMAKKFTNTANTVVVSTDKLTTKNEQLYRVLEDLKNQNNFEYYKRAMILKSQTDSLEAYLRVFRNRVVAKINVVTPEVADTLKLMQMGDILSTDEITNMLWGTDEYQPIKGAWTGYELKTKIDRYRDTVISLSVSENRNLIKNAINLDTEPQSDEEGESIPWVAATFRQIDMPTFLFVINNLKFEIKNAESQVLSDLVNAATEKNVNLSVKVAELGAKLENTKKEHLIEILKNQRELSQLSLDSKNREIDSTNRAIVLFVILFILSLVLIFYVIRSNLIRKRINIELQRQKLVIEEKNREITDSITYAKRLQEAILPSEDAIQKELPHSFIFYKPKDIVAGDFYWFESLHDRLLIAAADCTGHGVPGAMVSVVCSSTLNRAVKEFGMSEPGAILDKVRELVIETFEKSDQNVQDGMDISLLSIQKTNSEHIEVLWSGANNSLWYFENNTFKEIQPTKQPVGKFINAKPYQTHRLSITRGSTFYLFTDGFADQFGGPRKKKFKYKQLEALLAEIQSLPANEQKKQLDIKFAEWKGELEQVDDVCIIGIRLA